ncbi:PTS sugar transporter subunit IIA [Isoptericola aurantiacus]|uniref:PTS sugar transporter subunit IIA n=1 Tax=Isoptericola aurantiacus TaxID=3377839 RepID=UPI00383BA10E
MPLTVVAPVAGRVVAVTDVPDPVFAEGIVGPGTAVEPTGSDAVAPVAGRLVKLHPHAFVVQASEGPAVLVHLGIDTVELRGTGFTLHAAEGDQVRTGQRIVSWDPQAVRDGGRSAVCPVVVLEASPDAVALLADPGTDVGPGTPLLSAG